MEHNPFAFVQAVKVCADLGTENLLHRHRLWRNDVDLELALNQGRCNLHRDEAGADEDDALGLAGLGDNRTAVAPRAQVTNVRQIRADYLELHGRSARREQERIEFTAAAFDELEAFVTPIYRRDPRVQQQFDLVPAVEIQRVERDQVFARGTIKKVLRQSRAIVGNAVVCADHGQVAPISLMPQHFGRGLASRTAPHDYDSLRRFRGTGRLQLFSGLFSTHEELAIGCFNLPAGHRS